MSRVHSPGISISLTQPATNQMTLLFLLDVTTYNSYVLWWHSQGSLPAATVSGEGVDVYSRTPTTGQSPIQDYFRKAFHLHSIPCNIREGQNGVCHQQWPKISVEAVLMVILVTDGVGKEIWAWWPPFVATIKPRWRLLMHFLPYINVTHWSQVWL